SAASDELMLYLENDADLYRQKDAFLANMHRRMKKGTYDPVQGRKLWLYYVDRAAKKYAHEFGGTWHRIFPTEDRREVARELEQQERHALERGEYERYPSPKRSRDSFRRGRRGRDPRFTYAPRMRAEAAALGSEIAYSRAWGPEERLRKDSAKLRNLLE